MRVHDLSADYHSDFQIFNLFQSNSDGFVTYTLPIGKRMVLSLSAATIIITTTVAIPPHLSTPIPPLFVVQISPVHTKTVGWDAAMLRW